jgi:hypothetical protein
MWWSSPAPASGRMPPLGMRDIGRFSLPLMLNAWLMTLAGPVLNVALGRAAEPRLHLAAFWIAFTILLVCQSACLVIQQVTASALQRRVPFAAVALSGGILALGASTLLLAIGHTGLGGFVFHHVIPTPDRTALLARAVLGRLSVIPLLIALRGLASGVAVVQGRTEVLALATMVRVAVLAAVTTAVIGLGAGVGAMPAAGALVVATAAEAIFVSSMTLAQPRNRTATGRAAVSGREIGSVLRLAVPLAAASLVWTSARPLVGAVLGRLADPGLAQASFGVVFPILMVTCAPLWVFLDVALVLPRTPADLGKVVRFASLTSLAFAAGIAVLAFTPLRLVLLQLGAGMPRDLERAVAPALALIALEPMVLSARAIAQGLLVRSGRGGVVLALSPVKLAVMLGAGLMVTRLAPHANGAVLAAGLFIGGDAVDALLFGMVAVRIAGAAFENEGPGSFQAGLEDGFDRRNAA